MSESLERLRAYRKALSESGFVQIKLWVHADLAKKLSLERHPGESRAMTLERLVLGASQPRPLEPDRAPRKPRAPSRRDDERARRKLIARVERKFGPETVARLRSKPTE